MCKNLQINNIFCIFASNQRIIDLYSKLKAAGLPAIRSHQVEDLNIPIIVYKYDDDNIRDIIRDLYLECDARNQEKRIVLARGTNKCKELSGIKDLKFRYWKTEIPYLLIDAIFSYEENEMDLAFRKIRQVLGLLKYGDNHEARRSFIHEIEHDIDYNTKIVRFIKQIPSLSLSFTEWTTQTTHLLQNYWGLDNLPMFETYQKKTDNQGRGIREIADLPVEKYHQSNSKDGEYSKCVDTIHAVKGATFDAVLLFLSKDSRGESLSLRDFPIKPVAVMNESQRLIYVACSRAKQFLALAVPEFIKDNEIRNTLGANVVIRDINIQGELEFD